MSEAPSSARSVTVLIVDSTGRKEITACIGDTIDLHLSDSRVSKVTLEIDGILVERFGGAPVDITSLIAFEYTRAKIAFNMTVPFLRQQNEALKKIIVKWNKVGKRIGKLSRKFSSASYIDTPEFQGALTDISERIEKLSVYKPIISTSKKR
jgi:hypothetical protein